MVQERYIFSIEDALEMVFVFDSSGVITYANAAARDKLEYGNDLCGRYVSDIFPNTFKLSENGFVTDYVFGNTQQQLMAYRRNLTCFPVEVKIYPADMADEDAKAPTYICMANDILEREYLSREIEQVKQEANQAMKVKSEFVANVTHELRTPVNGILGNVRELFDMVTDEQVLRQLRIVERCCGDMNKIINNILDFSKLEAGKFTLEPRKFHFRNMLDYVKAQHINKITEKGLGFFMTVSPQIPEHVIGDELRIVQILNNLLSNAQKFTTIGKITLEIIMTARVKDSIELFFIVKDTGIGIDEADKDKLFQSFSQVDASITRKYGGTGLGLNICKQLAELMGGRIQVESEKNRGSTFSFSIWVELCEEEKNTVSLPDEGLSMFEISASAAEDADETAGIREYGTPENMDVLKRNLSKLILCVEMENWEKSEIFMGTIRQLTEGAPQEVSRAVLRLKLAIQRGNYDKTIAGYEELNHLISIS